MRKLAMIFAVIPLMAMSAPPRVAPSNQPVPIAELRALEVVQACVVRTLDQFPENSAPRLRDGVQVDYVTSQTERARQAQRANNAPVFSEARANVINTVRALGYSC